MTYGTIQGDSVSWEASLRVMKLARGHGRPGRPEVLESSQRAWQACLRVWETGQLAWEDLQASHSARAASLRIWMQIRGCAKSVRGLRDQLEGVGDQLEVLLLIGS